MTLRFFQSQLDQWGWVCPWRPTCSPCVCQWCAWWRWSEILNSARCSESLLLFCSCMPPSNIAALGSCSWPSSGSSLPLSLLLHSPSALSRSQPTSPSSTISLSKSHCRSPQSSLISRSLSLSSSLLSSQIFRPLMKSKSLDANQCQSLCRSFQNLSVHKPWCTR